MRINRKVCGWKGCKKSYVYTKWFNVHTDKEHPEIAKEPLDIMPMIMSEDAMKAMNAETEAFIYD